MCVGLCLKNQTVLCTLVCSQPFFVLLSAYEGAMERGLKSERTLLGVCLYLKNEDVMCTLVCSRPFLGLLSAYVGDMERGLRSEDSFGCSSLLEKSKCYMHISLLLALSCFANCICTSQKKRPWIRGLFFVWVLVLEIYMERPLDFARGRGM